jgi:putative ABC transport system permease protein
MLDDDTMWLITLRDLQWRRRRFILAIMAAGLAFSLALIMNGTLQHMRNESGRTVRVYDGNAWVVAHGASGPFTTSQFVPVSTAAALRQDAGVTAASPLLVVRSVIDKLDVNIVGYEVGGATQPRKLAKGTAPTTRGVAMVDTSLHRHVGDTLTFAGRSYPVVALTSNTTFYFGMPTVFLPIEDVQDQFLAGQPLASAIVVRGQPTQVPADVDVLSTAQVKSDLDRPLAQTSQTLDIINGLLWIMAAGTIAAMVYLTALERTRDFAVLKATGASRWTMLGGLAIEATALSLFAAAVGTVLAAAISPSFPFPVETPLWAYIQLLVVALIVGFVASLAGLRRIARVDPALAFGGA